MKFFRRIFVLTLFCAIFSFVELNAQSGAGSVYSPYSVFGVGDIVPQGSAYNRSMGGVGIATRNNRYINYLNPAAISARDTLAFMLDLGVCNDNRYLRQGDLRSVGNTFNITNFVLSVPIYRSFAMAVGVTPYSGVSYDFSNYEKQHGIVGNTGFVEYQAYGEGAMTRAFISGGVTFWKRLSIGAEFDYYFGNIDKVSNKLFTAGDLRTTYAGYDMRLWGVGGKFGLQYEQRFNNNTSLVLGATYQLKTPIKGMNKEYYHALLSEVQDSIYVQEMGTDKVSLGDELGVGLALKTDKLSVEVNYVIGDWRSSGFSAVRGFAVNTSEGKKFESTLSHAIRAGVEYVPNRNDIRYYHRRMAYRAGAYYETANFTYGGSTITSSGITLGVTFPVFRWYNGLSIGLDFGRRGTLQNNLIRETYFRVNASMNIHDIWFQKPKYE